MTEADSAQTLSVGELADRRNMVYMGTTVVRGRGLAVITETGMRTQLGNIATMIQQVRSEPTPLQRRLDRLGKALAVVALVLVAIVFALGMMQGGALKETNFLAIRMMRVLPAIMLGVESRILAHS